MKKITCPVIDDLMPLYVDEVLSEDSRSLVKDHLSQCRRCQGKYEHLEEPGEEGSGEAIGPVNPFKKIRQYYFRRIAAGLLLLPLIYFLAVEISGDGVGITALLSRHRVQVMLNHLEEGQFEAAVENMSFSGGRYGAMENPEMAKSQWIRTVKELKERGILEFVSHGSNRVTTDDGATWGYVQLVVKLEGEEIPVNLAVAIQDGAIAIMSMDFGILGEEQSSKVDVEKINRSLSTYNPG